MRFIDLLNELASSIGIGSVAPDETGSVTLLFDNVYPVTFMPAEDGDAVFFQCEVGDASQLGSNGCRVLLEASFSQTDGAAFAIQPTFQKVMIWKRFGEFSSLSEFEKAINDFLGQVVTWKQCLASGDFHAKEADNPQPPYMTGITSNIIRV